MELVPNAHVVNLEEIIKEGLKHNSSLSMIKEGSTWIYSLGLGFRVMICHMPRQIK